MIFTWVRFAAAAVCILLGLFFTASAVFGVNKFRHALNRMHTAALGDTLGILFIITGLIVIRGFSFNSLKLLLVIVFFWIASPVSSHMLSRMEATTDEDLGELIVIHKETDSKPEGEK